MKSELLKLGSDRILIDEDGILHRLSLEEPDTEAMVSTFDYQYPGSGWDRLSGKTITYFKYQLTRDDIYRVRTVKIPTGEIVEFYTLSYTDNANRQCEYYFAFVGACCVASSPCFLQTSKNYELVREWQTQVIEDCCTVIEK